MLRPVAAESTDNKYYGNDMLTKVLIELLCESATAEDVKTLWEAYKINPVEEFLQPIMFRCNILNDTRLNAVVDENIKEVRKTISVELFERSRKNKIVEDKYARLSPDPDYVLTLLVCFLIFISFFYFLLKETINAWCCKLT